jgi:dipeptidyl aminopeptidase/acylaminoacyl peptidase
MNADGSGQRRLTRDRGIDSNPSWSPDGKRVLFDRVRNPELEGPDVWVMKADGTKAQVLIGVTAGINADPEWQPGPNLAVAVSPHIAVGRLTRALKYALVVENRSAIPATAVKLTHSLAGARLIAVRSREGTCRRTLPVRCSFTRAILGKPLRVQLKLRALRRGRLRHTTQVVARETEASIANNRVVGTFRIS